MDCELCLNSRTLLYREKMDVKLPYLNKVHQVEATNKIESHVICLYYEKIMSTKINKNYCEHEHGPFDDMPEKYEPYPEYD